MLLEIKANTNKIVKSSKVVINITGIIINIVHGDEVKNKRVR